MANNNAPQPTRPAEPLWAPSADTIRHAQVTAFAEWLARERDLQFADYDALWRWSVDDLEGFWSAVWQFFGVQASAPYERILQYAGMPGAQWCPGARLNFVDNVFRHAHGARPAIVFGREGRSDLLEVGWFELQAQVAALAASLRALGVARGDRVVAYLPNVPQTVIAFLAVASIGAVWSVCSPDMGPAAVLDRFQQIEPRVLIAADGYRYGGKVYDRAETVAALVADLPSLQHVIVVPLIDAPRTLSHALSWAQLLERPATLQTEQVPFDHPLWIVYSSGTTGLPKAIVHGQGGIVLEGLQCNALHNDLGPQDRFHWYSTTGWIMWNIQVNALLTGCTICLYDGNPGWPDLTALWRFVAKAGVTFFGAGAAFYAQCMKAGVEPARVVDLGRLRALGSTGSPLSPEAYRWIYAHVKRDLWLTSVSGGTDFCGGFVGGLPTLPVYEGEMQCRELGTRVEAFNERGEPVIDEVGELVCTAPLPSMPLYFWNDADGARYRDSYFDMFPGVWRHGDWIRIVPRPGAFGAIIYGRSDATINRHGIRMGTAELYRAVEALDEVADSLVVDLEYLGRPSYMPLFVVLREGRSL
ncbi:MAG TPA: acetoacetate--CoA ligase, partial [Burkholderiaceae bacterium]|nr:acetoacetate--CoA ligase [Burkholderiaceae bacterium]